MKYLVVLALAALAQTTVSQLNANIYNPYIMYNSYVPTVTPQGYLADTPEVAAARAAHLAEHAKASGAAPNFYNNYYQSSPFVMTFQGPQAFPVVNDEGFVADTPEVAAAKLAHYAEKSKAVAAAGISPSHLYQEYHTLFRSSPLYQNAQVAQVSQANIVVTPEGFLADTPEVSAAKFAHFAEVAKAQHRF